MDGKCSKGDILPRLEIIGLPVPKVEPKPIVPIFPKPVDLGVPNAHGRMPEIAPEPAPVPKPADSKPAAPACKRADNGCVPDNTYTFSGTNFVEKGRLLREKVQGVLGKNVAINHKYDTEKERYTIKAETHASPIIGNTVEGFFKQQGIDMGRFNTRDNSWTRYEVHGTNDKKKVGQYQSAVDVYVSVKHKAMIPQRLFRNDDALYDHIPLAERLPMSEWLFQLWKRAVGEGHADYGVQINVGDLQKIIGKDVGNPEAKAIVFKAQQEVGGNAQTFTVKPEDEAAFNAMSSSSSGVSKWNMLHDHNGAAELNNLKPVQIDVTTKDALPMLVWTFSRS